jgi:TRAP-type mannitol/chloroaromatic compound transport system permease small subunit
MQGLLSLSSLIDRMTTTIGKSVIWLIFLAILISATNAIVRKVFNVSSNAWLEAQWYLFGAAFMLAAAYTLKENEHIRIDVVYGALSRKTQHRIDLFGHLFFLLPFAALMTWMLVPYAYAAFQSGQVSSNASGLIIWPARAVLAFGFVLLLFQAISEIIKKVAVMQGLIEDPSPFVSAHEAAELEGAQLAAEVARLARESDEAKARATPNDKEDAR